MGLMQHHAIIITGREEHVSLAHVYASGLDALVSPVSATGVNGIRSFALWPDGSKEGWQDSDDGDTARDSMVAFLESLRYEDGSSPLEWVEVTFGDLGAGVVRSDHVAEENAAAQPGGEGGGRG